MSLVDVHSIDGIRPKYEIYIGRDIPYQPFKNLGWGNPYSRKEENCLRKYETFIREKIAVDPTHFNIEGLRNKILGCWCLNTETWDEPLFCHGQVLLKILAERKEHSFLVIILKENKWMEGVFLREELLEEEKTLRTSKKDFMLFTDAKYSPGMHLWAANLPVIDLFQKNNAMQKNYIENVKGRQI